MKTNDFTFQLTSKKLKENIEKQFNTKVNLEKYSREQLEDMRNKIRTRIFQLENSSGINELLTNETYQKDKAMVALLTTRIKEMLGEDIKKLRDRIDQINEAKKGTRAKKTTIKGKGTNDGNLANNYPPYDKVTRGDVIAGATGKDQRGGAKKTKEAFGDYKRSTDDTSRGGGGFKPGSKYGGKTSTFDPSTDEPSKDEPNMGGSRSMGSQDDDLPKVTSTEPGRYGDPFSTRTMADLKMRKHSGEKVSPEEKLERRMASRYLELLSGGEPVTDDEIQAVIDTMRTSDSYRARVMKRVKMGEGIMEAPKSEKQRKAAAIALAAKRGGKKPKPGTASAEMSDMPEKELKKFAKKPEGKKLPEKAPKKKVKEANEIYKRHVQIVNESLVSLLRENEEEKAKAITAAGDIVNDYTSWMQRVGQYQTKSMIELFDAIRSDFGPQEADTFKAAVVPALDATLDVLMQQREAISNAVAVLAGEAAPEGPAMGVAPTAEPAAAPAEPGVPSAEPDQMNTADMTAAAEPAATGRELRESAVIQKIKSSHSIISKLSK